MAMKSKGDPQGPTEDVLDMRTFITNADQTTPQNSDTRGRTACVVDETTRLSPGALRGGGARVTARARLEGSVRMRQVLWLRVRSRRRRARVRASISGHKTFQAQDLLWTGVLVPTRSLVVLSECNALPARGREKLRRAIVRVCARALVSDLSRPPRTSHPLPEAPARLSRPRPAVHAGPFLIFYTPD